jgi:hypothetical protein
MPELKPITEYKGDIAKSGASPLAHSNIIRPDQAEDSGELMALKHPQSPIVIRVLGKPISVW